jgi:hypothetical protein
MKHTLLFLTFALALGANGQLTNRQFNLYGKYSYGFNSATTYNNYGLTGELIVHRHFGLNYNFDFVDRSDDYRQIHTPMGIVGGPLIIAAGLANLFDGDSTSSGGLALVGIVLFFLPEGVSFHQNIGYRWDISPYANILGIDFIKNRATDESWIKYACSFGIRGTYVLKNRITFSPFVETRKTAGVPWGFGAGFGIGVLFGERDEFTEETP